VLSRRETLLAGAGAVAAGTVAGTKAPAAALTRDLFTPLVETTFELEPSSGNRHAVKLVGVPGSELAFALQFSAVEPVQEGIYRVHHPQLPAVELFLAPIDPTPGRIEAVVNRHGA